MIYNIPQAMLETAARDSLHLVDGLREQCKLADVGNSPALNRQLVADLIRGGLIEDMIETAQGIERYWDDRDIRGRDE